MKQSKSLKKDLIRYVIPTVMSLWVFTLYSMVDGIFVARGAGELALASVNISIPYINFIFALSLIFSVGASTMISISFGRGDKEKANRIFSMNTIVLVIAAVTMAVLSLIFLPQLANFLGATDATRGMVMEYLRYILLFSPCYIISYSFEILVKVDGYPQLATKTVILGALTNCVLDYLFVIVWKQGVAGAAIATGLSQMLTVLVYLKHFLGKKSKLSFVKCRPRLSVYRSMIPLGLSDGFTELSSGIVIFMFNHVVLSVAGDQGVACYTIAAYVNSLVVMTMVGVSQGMQPLVGFHYGKEDRKACRSLYRYALIAVLLLSAASFAVVNLFAGGIVSMFLEEGSSQIFAEAVGAVKMFSFSFLVVGYNVVTAGYYAATERPTQSLIISVGRGLVLLAASLFPMAYFFGINGIWLATLVSESACLLLVFAVGRVSSRRENLRNAQNTIPLSQNS